VPMGFTTELREVVLEACARAPGPMTVATLKKALTKPFREEAPLREALAALLAEGQLHIWPGTGTAKSPKYWIHEPAAYVRERLLKLLRDDPQTAAELAKQLKGLGCSSSTLARPLAELAEAGRAYRHLPPKGAALSWALKPPAPEKLLPKTLKTFLEERAALSKRGFPAAQLEGAARALFAAQAADAAAIDPTDLPGRLLAILRLANRNDALPLKELRNLTSIAKAEFDAAILALAEARRIHLNAHDRPAGLSEEERYGFVADGQGHYFVAASLRE